MPVPQPGTSEHNRLRDMVVKRLRQSDDQMQARHKRWKESERAYRMFVDPDQIQQPIEPTSGDQHLLYPYPTSVVIPLSFAIAQTIIAFHLAQFTNQMPWLKVGNRNPESAGPAKAQELILQYQLERNQWVLRLYQWLLDAYRYGQGVARIEWRVDEREQVVRHERTLNIGGAPVPMRFTEKRPVLEYEGNDITIIDPFEWRPDSRVPVAHFQDGSYCGEAVWRSYFELLRLQDSGILENVHEIPQRTQTAFQSAGKGNAVFNASDRDRIMQVNRFFGEHSFDPTDAGMVLVETAAIDLIPAEAGLGDSTHVERMYVTVSNRSVVNRAEPFPYSHHDFNYAVMESNPDTHSLMNPSTIELMEPLTEQISWLYNSHIENVRKGLNNQFVYDPTMVEQDDILNPTAGNMIRLTEAFYGIQGAPGQAVQQLQVQDMTGRNIETAGLLQDMLQRLSAANDAIQGQETEEGKTATEINIATNLASGRLRMMARLHGTQALQPLAQQMVQNNMEFLETEQYVRLAGTLEQEYQAIGRSVEGGVSISPEEIQGLFDFPVFDSMAPLDPIRTAQVWMQIQRMAIENPALQGVVDHVGLFRQVVHQLGISDVGRFISPQQVQVMPDAQVQQQVEAGNLVGDPNSTPQTPEVPLVNGAGSNLGGVG